ncbi:MAG: putative Ig domain-containing protein, partial [Arenimonas sp.]|nr:putative Ig domain-containing protein [Arenimonas sp.]
TATDVASPITLTGLTNGTAYTFTVTATNIAGTGSSSAASNSVTPAASQTITFANPGSQNFGTTPTLTAPASSGLTPPFTSSTPTVCTITPGGLLALVSTGSCTINADQAGNASYLPATQVSHTFAVNPEAPIANPVSSTVAAGSSDNSIPLNVTGGAPDSVAVASAPSHGTAVASGNSITYTPAADYSGPDSFTYTATNITGTSAPATISITVNPAAPIANPVTASVPYNSSGTPIVLMLSGGAATSVAIASAPTHGTAVASGTSITYTPASGYSGSDSFTYTATNVTGTSAAAVVSVTVTAPVLDLTPASGPLVAGRVGNAYNLTIGATSGTGPYSYGVTSGRLPAGLGLDSATGVLSGTPGSSGSFTFTIAATDIYGATGSASYALTIAPAPALLTFAPPSGSSLPEAMAGEAYSASIVASGGTGGIVYSLKSGTLPDGMILNVSTGALSGPLAASAEAKRYSFTIAARDSVGQTGEANYDLNVTARDVTAGDQTVIVPPGSAPPLVYLNRGATGGPFTGASVLSVSPQNAGKAEIIQGEVAALGSVTPIGYYLKFTPATGFSGSVAIGYVLKSGLGTSNVATVTFGLSHDEEAVRSEIDGLVRDFVGTRQSLLSSSIKIPGLSERRAMSTAQEPVTTRISPSNEAMTYGFSTSLVQIDAARQAAEGHGGAVVPLPFNFWIDGSLMMHRSEEDGDQWGTFAMLSAGADYMIGERALIGFSMHFDRMTDPTDGDAKLVGNGWLAGPYASIALGDNLFLDTSLLYGGSWNDIDTTFFDGSFDTRRLLFNTELKGQWQLDENTLLVPSLRVVYLSETVDDYSVTNGTGSTIDMDGFTEEQMRMSVGATVSRRYLLDDGVTITPKLAMTGGFAGMDGEGLFGTATAGIEIGTETNWDLDLTLLYGMEGNGDQSGGAKAAVRVRF